MKNVIITGATGMIGGIVLRNCLQDPRVGKVTSLLRKPSGATHPKLTEVIVHDFTDYSKFELHMQDQDVAFFCIGVYTGAVPRDEFRKITVDYTKAFAEALIKNSPHTEFCFLSGAGADQTEKSNLMFAKDKGIAENILINLHFDHLHIFRPAYIYPVEKRKEPNTLYRFMRAIYKPFLSWAYPNGAVTSLQLANVMTDVGLKGGEKLIYENKDIRNESKRLPKAD